MDGQDIAPPPKRRRTSSASSHDRRETSRRHYSSSSSPDHFDDAREYGSRRNSYQAPSHSRSQSRSPTRSRSNSRSRSHSPSITHETPSKARLAFKPLYVLPSAHARGITTVKFSPDYALLATGSADATINIYSVPTHPSTDPTFKLLRTLRAHRAGINALAWSPIGPPYTLASASDDKTILLWSPLSSDFPIPPSPLEGHSNYVYSLAFSPKGNMLVSGSYDEAVFLWDVRSARVMRQLPAHSDPVSGVDFVRDGTMVCSCASDGLIRIWDSATGQCLKTLVDEDRKPVTAVRFSPNGKFVVAWTLDDCVRLWMYMSAEARCVKTYLGHVNRKFSLSGCIGDYGVEGGLGVESREAFVVSGSEDGDLVAWDVSSKDILWRGRGAHKDVVLAADFGRSAEDGRGLLVSVGKDRALKVWIEEFRPGAARVKREDDMEVDGHVVKMEIKREDTEMEMT